VQSDNSALEAVMASLYNPTLQKAFLKCWICGNPVSLEYCKIDEYGQAVHENCYVAKIALQNGYQDKGHRAA
jgi:hypothetical protein